MSEIERFEMLLARTGVGLPRGVLGVDARALAVALAGGYGDADVQALLVAAGAEHWPQLSGAIAAALERARGEGEDPTLEDAIELTLSHDAANPLAVALVSDAARILAGVVARSRERLIVLDRRLAGDGAGEDLTRTVGDIVIDLLELDAEDYEDEIAAYLGVGESDASRAQLARATADEEIRAWAREELAWVTDGLDGAAAAALRNLAASEIPEDPAADPVWLATILALVEEAIELATVDQVLEMDDESADR